MRVRRFDTEDLKDVARIMQVVFGDCGMDQQTIVRYMAMDGAKGWVCEIGGIVMGVLMCQDRRGGVVKIDWIAISSGFNKRGGGSMVLREVFKLQRPIRVYVPEENLESQLFFRAMGFTAVKIRPDSTQTISQPTSLSTSQKMPTPSAVPRKDSTYEAEQCVR